MIKTYDFERHCHVSRLSRKKKKKTHQHQPGPGSKSPQSRGARRTWHHLPLPLRRALPVPPVDQMWMNITEGHHGKTNEMNGKIWEDP